MFFKSKYVFETRATRTYRRMLNVAIVLSLAIVTYSSLCLILIIGARNEAQESKATFVQSSPDLIVVFTGGAGRIQHAVKLSQVLNQPNVFITGVYEKNSVKTLMNPFDPEEKESTDYIEIDYTARNTVENVLSTLKHLRANRGINKILVVSSDYHIMRIQIIFNSLLKKNEAYELYFSPVEIDYFSLRNLRILYTEVFKLARTKVFLLLWDQKSPIDNYYLN